MPLDRNAPVVKPLNVLYTGEVPRTRFVDWLDAVEVRLVNGPSDKIYLAMAEMQQASWSPDPELTRDRAVKAVSAGTYGDQPLPLNMEVPHFTFFIGGISRAITHQIVRTRVGATFAQKCTGDADVRHDDVLVPRCFNKPGQERLLEEYVDMNLRFKDWYARAVDEGTQSLHALRYAMPHGLAQYIYADYSFLALKELVGKRWCPEQPIEWQIICVKIVDSLVWAGYREFAEKLKPNCLTRSCHWHRHGNNDPRIGRLYWPDETHDVEPWNPASFLYQGTAADVLGGPPFKERRYVGFERVV